MANLTASENLTRNVARIEAHFSHTGDLKVLPIHWNQSQGMLVYLESLVKDELIQFQIFDRVHEADAEFVDTTVSPIEVVQSSDIVEIGKALLEGYCALLTEQDDSVQLINAAQTQWRNIIEPKGEQVTLGPHDGFVEQLNVNIFQLRNRIRHPKLKVTFLSLGKLTKTKIALVYMENLADLEVVAECERRLAEFPGEHLYSTGNIAEFLEEHPFSPFPQTMQTERPDRCESYIMDGKIAVLVEGNPTALLLPITFFAFYQSPDDYNNRWIIGTFNRIIRMISFVFAISLPAIYIAIVSFHSEVLPIGILYSVKVAITYVPFPPIMEAITMQVILELLKEAAIRLHSSIAQTIGVVGGLVIGTAIVETHLISHTMIVVIGLTAISSFVTPINEFGTSLRVLGFTTILAATLFGFFGISIMLMFIFIHLCKLEMFGMPYFSPFGPFRSKEGLGDTFVRYRKVKLPTC
ncbi:spore germination protein [Paenibacillus sp. LHD-117]|uniref:spore germination protein n=1 Tax=Paenibacillus sp. LHD-117 TaxID=3071412 RepID=UPI0027DEDC05|nr:spore germination protein [Paenibacillus sp. LHD-117]MDQ6420040.1 spore germination protein [Paenibacillus sp. LHD-117]